MACEVWFYHLERASLDQVLPELLEKTLARDWRALVRSNDPARVEYLDIWLWAFRDESFLPHGTADEPGAARQPILLTTTDDNANGAKALFVVDDAEPGDLTEFERCIVIFDGHDEAAVTAARTRWPALKAAGHPVTYWRQGESRGWEKQD
ncbi:MAG: DNA polymerase III subunit chi [Caulobacteraceae bacterium]